MEYKRKKHPRSGRSIISQCKCPVTAPAWPECCAKHLLDVVDGNQQGLPIGQPEALDGGSSFADTESVPGKSMGIGVHPPGSGGYATHDPGVGVQSGAPSSNTRTTSNDIPPKHPASIPLPVKRILSGEYRLTKKLLKEQTEAYLASEGLAKAAKRMLELIDHHDPDVAFKAAKDVMDRLGVKDQKESLQDLAKIKGEDSVSTEWLERIVDSGD